MPAVNPKLLDCVFYVYPDVDAARRGERVGGTGFLVSVLAPGAEHLSLSVGYAVTNRHVVAQAIEHGGAPVLRLNNQDGAFEVIPTDAAAWIPHPAGDDVTIMQIGFSADRYRFAAAEASLLVRPTEPVEFSVGKEAMMVGRFITREGKQRNTPAVRFGNVAMLPLEPVLTDQGLNQDTFLVEMRSLPGYSGSPVFVYRTMQVGDIERGWEGTRIRLLGIDYCHLASFEPVLEDDRKTKASPPKWVPQNSGMAGVVPAWKITELLNDEEVVRMREEAGRQWAKEHGDESSVQLDTASGDESEFAQFEDLARKLVNVPKKEIDEKRKDES